MAEPPAAQDPRVSRQAVDPSIATTDSLSVCGCGCGCGWPVVAEADGEVVIGDVAEREGVTVPVDDEEGLRAALLGTDTGGGPPLNAKATSATSRISSPTSATSGPRDGLTCAGP